MGHSADAQLAEYAVLPDPPSSAGEHQKHATQRASLLYELTALKARFGVSHPVLCRFLANASAALLLAA